MPLGVNRGYALFGKAATARAALPTPPWLRPVEECTLASRSLARSFHTVSICGCTPVLETIPGAARVP